MPTEEEKQKIEKIKKVYDENGGGLISTREIFSNAESVKDVFMKLVEHALAHHLKKSKSLDDFDATKQPLYGIHTHASNATLCHYSRQERDLISRCQEEVVRAKKEELQGDEVQMRRK